MCNKARIFLKFQNLIQYESKIYVMLLNVLQKIQFYGTSVFEICIIGPLRFIASRKNVQLTCQVLSTSRHKVFDLL